MDRSRSRSSEISGSAFQPHWRWRSLAYLVVGSIFCTVFALLWVQEVGGIGLDKALAGSLLTAGWLASGTFLYDVIWWRWQRWRLLVVASAIATFGVYLLFTALLSGWYAGSTIGRWASLAMLPGLAAGAMSTITWCLRNHRLRAEGWRW